MLAAVAASGAWGRAGHQPSRVAAHYRPLPRGGDSWFWEIDPPRAGIAGLPPMRAAYPAPGSARIWDTDLFEDSNTSSGQRLGIPTGRSPVVAALHASGHYAVCYVDAGAYQTGWPDDADFAPADYGHGARRYGMRGYGNEWWLDIRGFRGYRDGRRGGLTGAARDIAVALGRRIRWCRREGQDALEPDDIGAYTQRGDSGVPGGGWGITRADERGFERWLAYTAHRDGLAVMQKNDPADAGTDVRLFDGALSEECNRYADPCAGPGGDWDSYLRAGKPVLNAEYVQDGEATARFCAADLRAGIWGALFSVSLNGARDYRVCWGPAASSR